MSDSVSQSFLRAPVSSLDRVGEPHRIQEVHDQERSAQQQRKNPKRNPFPAEGNGEAEKPDSEASSRADQALSKQENTPREGPGLVIDITV